jgi:hypothetical protein
MDRKEAEPPAVTAKRTGIVSTAAVTAAVPVPPATKDDLGPWLARQWGVLADAPADLLDALDL